MLEDRRFIGIEREEEFVAVARAHRALEPSQRGVALSQLASQQRDDRGELTLAQCIALWPEPNRSTDWELP